MTLHEFLLANRPEESTFKLGVDPIDAGHGKLSLTISNPHTKESVQCTLSKADEIEIITVLREKPTDANN